MTAVAERGRTALYDGWAPYYDELLGEAGFAHIWPAFRRACRRFAMHIGTAADFGCGTGLFLAALARTAPEAVLFGVDRSPGMLLVARRRLAGTSARLILGDITTVRLPRPVDVATVNYLLTTNALRMAIGNFARHLKRGGYLVMDFLCAGGNQRLEPIVQRIGLPGFRALWDIRTAGQNTRGRVAMRNCRREPDGWRCFEETHDQRWWSVPEMARRMREAGMATLSVEPLGGVPPVRGGRWLHLVAQRR